MKATPLCIYHANCADGFGAAWVVRKALGDPNVDFHPGVYQTPPPDVTGRDVILVDFSYKRQVLLDMAATANSITIIDHHKTAAEDLQDLPDNVTAYFDMDHSGAMLTWHCYFPGDPPPPLLQHIEDCDLWRFHLPDTRAVSAALFSYPYDFDLWDQFMAQDIQHLVADGIAIERKHHKDIRELLAVSTRKMRIGGFVVPVANLPYTLASDAAGALAVGQPFAACYMDTPDGRSFSLRSRDDGIDVAAVAQRYGGGGHRNSAGFLVSYSRARIMELGENEDAFGGGE